jgi:hypothetical protein
MKGSRAAPNRADAQKQTSGSPSGAIEQARVNAFGFEAGLPSLCRRSIKQDLLPPIGREPAGAAHFLVELALAPTGVAERNQVTAWTAALGNRFQDIDRAGQRAEPGHGDRVLSAPIIAVQHKPASRFDWAAMKDRGIGCLARLNAKLLEQATHTDPGALVPDAYSYGAILVMNAHRDHGMLETWIADAGHGQKQLSGQETRTLHLPKMRFTPSGRKP